MERVNADDNSNQFDKIIRKMPRMNNQIHLAELSHETENHKEDSENNLKSQVKFNNKKTLSNPQVSSSTEFFMNERGEERTQFNDIEPDNLQSKEVIHDNRQRNDSIRSNRHDNDMVAAIRQRNEFSAEVKKHNVSNSTPTKKQHLLKTIPNNLWVNNISLFLCDPNTFFRNPLIRCCKTLRIELLSQIDVNKIPIPELKIISEHFSILVGGVLLTYIEFKERTIKPSMLLKIKQWEADHQPQLRRQSLTMPLNIISNTPLNTPSRTPSNISSISTVNTFPGTPLHLPLHLPFTTPIHTPSNTPLNISGVNTIKQTLSNPPTYAGRLFIDHVPRFVDIYENTRDPYLKSYHAFHASTKGPPITAYERNITDKFRTSIYTPDTTPPPMKINYGTHNLSVFNYFQSESHLRQWISICLDTLQIDHVKETLSFLTRPVAYIQNKKNLAHGIEERLKDVINFWSCLQNNRAALRQRYVIELLLLVTVFYLTQVYKERMLGVCKEIFYEDMKNANLDAFIRFQILDWHSNELIVGENVKFYVYQPQHSAEILSVANHLFKKHRIESRATSIFPNPISAISTTRIDNFYLRCLLTFSFCTQETSLVDLPLLKPLQNLQSLDNQIQVLKKDDLLIIWGGRIRKVSSFQLNPLERPFRFEDLLHSRFEQCEEIEFPPTEMKYQTDGEDLYQILAEGKRTRKLREESSPQLEICCIEGCNRSCYSGDSFEFVSYDSLIDVWPLKQEYIEEMSLPRNVCSFHYRIDKIKKLRKVHSYLETRSINHTSTSLTPTLCSLLIRNAKRKFPTMTSRIDSMISNVPNNLSENEYTEKIAQIILRIEDEYLNHINTKGYNSHLFILIQYIEKMKPSYSDELHFLCDTAYFTMEQLIDMISEIARMLSMEKNDFASSNQLLEMLVSKSIRLFPNFINRIHCIAFSGQLSFLQEFEAMRYFLLICLIRMKTQPLGVRKLPLLFRIFSYEYIDGNLERMISSYCNSECTLQ